MSGSEFVVLVHGLWTNRYVMSWLGSRLRHAGFGVASLTYPSLRHDLDRNAARLAAFVETVPAATVHVVAHSLGGLVTLAYLGRERPQRVRRVVLLGSPVQGCEVGRRIAARGAMRPFLGKTTRLWTSPEPLLADDRYEIGTIAGTVPVGLGRLFVRLDEPSDGVVRPQEARYARERDHIDLDLAHSQMLVSPAVAKQAIAFLRTGRFDR
ncbi:MAG: alpha/beta fold hydrolase [Burkholderiales bacterium]|jgi:pimeloyl-ACP methyl ester carboxylesterase|nr:alpha/beta fold hydrolase [Burkholderiales bacterium]